MYVILRYAVQHFSYCDERSEANNNLVLAFRPSWMIDNVCIRVVNAHVSASC